MHTSLHVCLETCTHTYRHTLAHIDTTTYTQKATLNVYIIEMEEIYQM